jgi:glycosyltransferase involved in cell wall biosynthesis
MAHSLSVVHLDDGRIWRGGQHQVFLLISELQKLGVRQALAAPPGAPLAERARALGIEVFPFTAPLGELDPFAPGRLARFARNWGAALLHAHTGHAHAQGLRAVRKLRSVPLVVTRRVDFAVGQGWWSRRKYTAPGQHFIAISTAVRDVLIAGGVAPGRIAIVHSGVPAIPAAYAWPRERVRAELGIAPNEIAIVNIGALTDHKGQQYLIAAAPAVLAHCPRARIHILGSGELHAQLAEQIQQLKLEEKVILHGHVTDARLKLAGFDLFVSSSHLEGLGTVILDAMLAGLPVVATAAGGVVDIVKPNETGLLAPPRDPVALATALIAGLQLTPDTRRQLITNACTMVAAQFSAAATARGTLEVYQRILKSS